jgi:AAA15 family ATPase/GTPase
MAQRLLYRFAPRYKKYEITEETMITAIEIKNFKGIGDRVKIDLKPITLLFGANSSGKSTIIQAMHYACEIFDRHNLDPDKTIIGGEALDLGGFENLVHKHDLSKTISMSFHLDLSHISLPDYGLMNSLYDSTSGVYASAIEDYEEDERGQVDREYVSSFVNSAIVEIEISYSQEIKKPRLTKYIVRLNGDLFAAAMILQKSEEVFMGFNIKHPLLVCKEESESGQSGFINDIHTALAEPTEFNAEDKFYCFNIKNCRSALPVWGIPLSFNFENEFFNDPVRRAESLCLLSQAFIGPGEVLKEELKKYRYLGPIRDIPPRNFEANRSNSSYRWVNGLAAWDVLLKDNTLLNQTNEWLSENHLNTGYSLYLKIFIELDLYAEIKRLLKEEKNSEALDLLKKEMDHLPVKKRLVLLDEQQNELEVLPQDIGVGISQVIPVVVIALDTKDGIVAIEQPELHIHPAMQVALGDMFINQIKSTETTFLIETHSEHLILRLLRRIREMSEGEDLPENLQLNLDELAVYYIDRKDNKTRITHLRIDKEGEFVDRWPKGFFEERAEELF